MPTMSDLANESLLRATLCRWKDLGYVTLRAVKEIALRVAELALILVAVVIAPFLAWRERESFRRIVERGRILGGEKKEGE